MDIELNIIKIIDVAANVKQLKSLLEVILSTIWLGVVLDKKKHADGRI